MEAPIKPQTFSKSELARLYRVHPATFRRWIDLIPDLELKPHKKLLTPLQVQKILQHLGQP